MSDTPIEDGGPAFPFLGQADYIDHEGCRTQFIATEHGNGLSLRDYFAARALVGELSCQSDVNGNGIWRDENSLALRCYAIADAMLRARQQ